MRVVFCIYIRVQSVALRIQIGYTEPQQHRLFKIQIVQSAAFKNNQQQRHQQQQRQIYELKYIYTYIYIHIEDLCARFQEGTVSR